MYKLLVSDVAGTIVSDDGVVMRAFEEAFKSVVPERWALESETFRAYAMETMGQSKGAVFMAMLNDQKLAQQANDEFDTVYREMLADVEPLPGVTEFFRDIRSEGTLVALNTGFTRETLDALLEKVGWSRLVDYSVTPAEAGSGRPSPDMIVKAMSLSGVTNPAEVIVVGDTVSDVESGRAAKAGLVVSVLTGAHSREVLEQAQPDAILESITEIRQFLD
jgi:phosphonatase-like hydrolase